MQLLHTKEEILKPQVSSGTLWVLSAATGRKLPVGDNKKREISWTAESCLHKYSPPLRSQCSHCLWQSVPHGRASDFFNCPRSGSVRRNTPLPCFGGIQDAALAHKRGSLEPLGFKRHSLGTFCCYWQKVTRRRQQKREGSWTAESANGIFDRLFAWEPISA